MNLVYKETACAEEYLLLRKAVGWEMICIEQAEQGLRNSAYLVSCYDEKAIVGTARIIWDGGYIAYLADVMILPAYQGCGIGRHLVKLALSFLRAQLKEGWKIKVVLVSTNGREGFYRKLGFTERPNAAGGCGMDQWLRASQI